MEAPRNIVNTAASFLTKKNAGKKKGSLPQTRESVRDLLDQHVEACLAGETSILEGLKAKADDLATEAKRKRDKKK